MNVENLAKMRALEQAYRSDGLPGHLLDAAIEEQREQISPRMRRVQFDVSAELARELDGLTTLLDLSRRQFLEAALIEALDKAKAAFFTTYKDATGHEFGEVEGGKPC